MALFMFIFFTSVAALLLWVADSGCTTTYAEPAFSSNKAFFVGKRDEVCTGLASRSNVEIDVGGNGQKAHAVFAQEGDVQPKIHWNGDVLEIDVQSTEMIYLSSHSFEQVRIVYYVPYRLAKPALLEETAEYKKRMVPLIEQGKVDSPGAMSRELE